MIEVNFPLIKDILVDNMPIFGLDLYPLGPDSLVEFIFYVRFIVIGLF